MPKKDLQGNHTDVRICQDLRGLNLLLKDDTAGIPRIQDLFDRLKGFKVASALDLFESYHQFALATKDQEKTAFSWGGAQYCFQGAPFGIKTLTAHFQHVITSCLQECAAFTVIFVDNILVFSSSPQKHSEHLLEVV